MHFLVTHHNQNANTYTFILQSAMPQFRFKKIESQARNTRAIYYWLDARRGKKKQRYSSDIARTERGTSNDPSNTAVASALSS